MDTAGKGEEGTNGETRIDIYALPFVKQIASGKRLCTIWSSAWCPASTSRGGMRESEGGSKGHGHKYTYK